MASVKNSFDLLFSGAEENGARPAKAAESTSSQNKKRRAKARAKNLTKGDPALGTQVGADAVPPAAPQEEKSSNLKPLKTLEDAGSRGVVKGQDDAPVVNDVANDDDAGFIVAARKSVANAAKLKLQQESKSAKAPVVPSIESSADLPSSSTPSSGVEEPVPLVGPVEAEKASLEAAATAYAGMEARRVQLWYEWIARGRTAHPEPQFGSLSWKQVFLQSRALEITVSSCLQPPLRAADRTHLQVFLASCLASPEAAQVLAQVVQDLAQGLASGPQDAELLQSAQLALSASVTALKEGETGWAVQALAARLADATIAEKLTQLGGKATEAEAQLTQLRADPNEMATLPERTRLSQQLVSLSEQRLLQLLPDDSPDPASGARTEDGPPARALSSIRQLAAQIRQRRTLASEAPVAPAPKVPAVKQEGSSKAAGEKRRELQESSAQLAEEGASLQIQLAAAEKEVERLRAAAAAVEARRQMIDAQLEASSQAVQDEGSELPGLDAQQVLQQAPAGQPPAIQLWCAQQLGVVHSLEALLLRPPEAGMGSGSKVEEEAVGAAMCRAVVDHLQALAAHVGHKQQQLKEAGQRLHFSQTKVASMEADLARLREQGKTQLARELEKPKETYLAMTKEWSARVEAIMADAEGVESALQRPALRTAVALLPPQPPVHVLLNQIGHLLHQIRVEHESIKAGPPPVAASEESANGVQATRAQPRQSAAPRRRPTREEGGASSGPVGGAPASLKRGEAGAQKGRRTTAAASAKLPDPPLNGGQLATKASHSNGHAVLPPAPVPKENAWGVQRPRSSASELAALGFQVAEEETSSPKGPE